MEQSLRILQHTKDVAFAIDRNLRIRFVNDRATEVTGLAKDQIVGRPITMMLAEGVATEENFAQFYEALDQLLDGQRTHMDMRLPLQAQGVGEFTGHLRLSAVQSGGEIRQVVGLVRALEEEEDGNGSSGPPPADFPQLVEEAAIGLCVGIGDSVRHVNRRFARMVGHSVDELVGKRFLDLVSSGDRERVRRALSKLPEEKYATDYLTCVIQTAGRDTLPVEIYLTRVIHEGTLAVNLMAVARPHSM